MPDDSSAHTRCATSVAPAAEMPQNKSDFRCQPARLSFGVGLTDVNRPVDSFWFEEFRQVVFGPAANAGDSRSFGGLTTNDCHGLDSAL